LNDFTSAHHYVECGEESRHDYPENSIARGWGYGHVMFLKIQDVVEPLSRGYLVDDTDPDYPPLCYACDDAHRQGGLAIWCHNGLGMEAPVAAALGKLDAFNLFDAYWRDPEYDFWYGMLNCGIRLPASTGSDWFICSAHRVYVDTGGEFDPEDWFSGMKKGRTFITNGPALLFEVGDQKPGGLIRAEPDSSLPLSLRWQSFYSLDLLQVLYNGEVAWERRLQGDACFGGHEEIELPALEDGWLAARLGSYSRNSYFHTLYAHTSPIYIETGRENAKAASSARFFRSGLDEALEWIEKKGRFPGEKQRREVRELFKEGRAFYQRLAADANLLTEKSS
jgi:hypothetical protein